MIVIMFGMNDVSDSANFFLKLTDVSDVGNNKLMFIHYFVVCFLHVHCIIGLAICHEHMTT